jgi:hypothetical protein
VTITREQVADLQPGDVVELTHASHEGVTLRGPARTHRDSGVVWVGDTLLMDLRGELRDASRWTHLTVVSRAPRLLYVNHPRTEPVAGDVVRDVDGDAWQFDRDEWWCASPDACDEDDPLGCPIDHFRPLTLLWDGQTKQVVP